MFLVGLVQPPPPGTKSKFTFDRSFIPDPLFLPRTPLGLNAVNTLLNKD